MKKTNKKKNKKKQQQQQQQHKILDQESNPGAPTCEPGS